MKTLWTFASKEKSEKFTPILDEHGIVYSILVKGKGDAEVTIEVEEKAYPKAKKLLLKHRERRTGSDLT